MQLSDASLTPEDLNLSDQHILIDSHHLQVLRLFAVHNILSAPIFEANTSHCSGFLDLVDILQAVLSWFNVRADAADRTDKLKKAGRKLLTEKIRSIKLANDGHLVYRNGSTTTLLEVTHCLTGRPARHDAFSPGMHLEHWDAAQQTQ